MEIEKIIEELGKTKESNKEKYMKANEFLSEMLKSYPQIREDKNLQIMIVYAYLHVENKAKIEIEKAFKKYNGPYDLDIKVNEKSTLNFLYADLNNLVQKIEKSHPVYVVSKGNPRIVAVTNPATSEKEEKKVMNISIWVDDLKSIANFTVWGEDQIMLYRNVVAGKTYKMSLNYNNDKFFAPKDPMAQEFLFEPNYSEMLKYITENFSEIKEPYSAIENAPVGKLFYMIGRVLKEAGGNILIFPTEPTNLKISLMRTPETMQLEDGEDIMVLGSIRRTKNFVGRDGKTYEPLSDYTLFENALIRLNPPEQKTENNDGVLDNDSSSDSNISPSDLGL